MLARMRECAGQNCIDENPPKTNSLTSKTSVFRRVNSEHFNKFPIEQVSSLYTDLSRIQFSELGTFGIF